MFSSKKLDINSSHMSCRWSFRMYLVPDVHLGEVLHHVDDVLGPGHRKAPGDEVILHVDHKQRPPGREDALEPVYGLAPVLELLQQMLNLILWTYVICLMIYRSNPMQCLCAVLFT